MTKICSSYVAIVVTAGSVSRPDIVVDASGVFDTKLLCCCYCRVHNDEQRVDETEGENRVDNEYC